MVMLSKLINYDKLLDGKFSELKNVITIVIKLVPEVKSFVKLGLKPEKVFNVILKRSYREVKTINKNLK